MKKEFDIPREILSQFQRYNGLDYWNDENSIPKGKRIINKVKKYLEEKLLKKGKN